LSRSEKEWKLACYGQGTVRRHVRRALHHGHGGLLLNTAPAHGIPETPPGGRVAWRGNSLGPSASAAAGLSRFDECSDCRQIERLRERDSIDAPDDRRGIYGHRHNSGIPAQLAVVRGGEKVGHWSGGMMLSRAA
jgi:hypothetical protein